MTRIAQRGCLLVGVMLGAACTSASKPPTASTATTATAVTTSRCPGAAASGAPGGGDVLVPGDIPDNQAYVVYQSTTGGYHLSVPEGWAQQAAGARVTFRDKFNSIQVLVSSTPSAPSVASAQSADMAALAASAPCFQAGKVSVVTRKAGPAVLITYRAESPADPVTGKVVRQDVERYEFWQAGHLAVLSLSSPQGSDNVDPWRKVTDSFMWGS